MNNLRILFLLFVVGLGTQAWAVDYQRMGGSDAVVEVLNKTLKAGDKIVYEGIHYIVNPDLKTLTVTYPTEASPTKSDDTYEGDVVIPDEISYEGISLKPTAIGKCAFAHSKITSLTIGNNVVETGGDACAYSSKMKTITIGTGLKKFAQGFCFACDRLETVYCHAESVPAIGAYLFSSNPNVYVKARNVSDYKSTAWAKAGKILIDPSITYSVNDVKEIIEQYSVFTPTEGEIGTEPGFYAEASARQMMSAIVDANHVDATCTQQGLIGAINRVIESYEGLYAYPLNDGIYYIENVYEPGMVLYGDKSVYDTEGLKAAEFKKKNPKFYFKLVRKGNNYIMQNMASGLYVGTTASGSGVGKHTTLTKDAENAQVFTRVKGGGYTIQSLAPDASVSYPISLAINGVSTSNYPNGDAQAARSYWLVHPAEAGMFMMDYNLENRKVREFVHEIEYDASSPSVVSDFNVTPPERRDQPAPATVHWQRSETSVSQKVICSSTKDFKNPQIINVDNSAACCEIFNLIPGNKYYYKVVATNQNGLETVISSASFTTTGQVRMLKADNICNIRDLGGWMTASGKRIKYGKIFRGARIESSVPAEELEAMRKAGIKVELDLREDDESGNITESYLGPEVEYRRIVHGQTCSRYDGITKHPELFKQDLEYVFSNVKAQKPVYFHCAIGADRTGTLGILIEGLLGVSESDIYKDYELTTFSNYGTTRTKRDLPKMMDYIKQTEGSTLEEIFFNFVTKTLGVNPQAVVEFKTNMLGYEFSVDMPIAAAER